MADSRPISVHIADKRTDLDWAKIETWCQWWLPASKTLVEVKDAQKIGAWKLSKAKMIKAARGMILITVVTLLTTVLSLTPWATKKVMSHKRTEAATTAGQVVPSPKKRKRVKPPKAEKITVRYEALPTASPIPWP